MWQHVAGFHVQKVASWSCSERDGDAMCCPRGSWGHSQRSPGASGESRWLPLELTPTCSPPPPNGASTTTLRSQLCPSWLCIAVLPSGVIAVRPPGRLRRNAQQTRTVAVTVWSNRSRVIFFSSPLGSSGSHDEERRWLPTSAIEFALAPKKPSEPNPPPTRNQDPIKSAQKDSFARTQHPGGREKENACDICREHLTKTRISAGQGSRWESSGTIWGIKLDQALTFCHSGFCIRPVARTAREPDLDGGLCSPTDALGSHCVYCQTVSPLKPSRSGPWLAQLCKGAATMPSTSFFSSRYARLFA